MYCNACGRRNADGSLFCVKCGAGLPVDATAEGDGARASREQADSPLTRPAPISSAEERSTEALLSGGDQEAWKAFIGPRNQDYYLGEFAKIHAAGGGIQASWHWPAFFVTGYWLLYRKMWGWAFVYFLFTLGAEGLVSLVDGVATKPQIVVLIGVLFISYVVVPLYANSLYYQRFASFVSKQRSPSAHRSRQLARLEVFGATSRVAAFVAGSAAATAIVGILTAIALPAYQVYAMRPKAALDVFGAAPRAARVEELAWRQAIASRSLASLEAYLARFPRDAHTTDARLAVSQLKSGVMSELEESSPANETALVTRAYPGWEKLVKTSEFKVWFWAQPAGVQVLSSSPRSADAIMMLALYYADNSGK